LRCSLIFRQRFDLVPLEENQTLMSESSQLRDDILEVAWTIFLKNIYIYDFGNIIMSVINLFYFYFIFLLLLNLLLLLLLLLLFIYLLI
jgi:hypothetical protein